MSTDLLLVRHAQSTWNADGRWQGWADPPLSELGVEQAQAAAAVLSTIGRIDGFVSSDLLRTRQTAAILAASSDGADVAIEARLRERNAGDWTGLTRSDIEARYPGYLENGRRPPGYEPDPVFAARVWSGLQAVLDVATGQTVVVTHGGVVRAIEHRLGGEPELPANLDGRWLHAALDDHRGHRKLRLGDRVRLAVGVETTLPRQL
jgi:probable phosphoglycerate mutase